jgi:phage terminase small subunit
MRERFRGHSRKDVFGALYVESGNAYRSALLAGYAATTAKSKAYLMAKRVRKELGME